MKLIDKINIVLNEATVKLWGKYNNKALGNSLRKINQEIGADLGRKTGEPLKKAITKIKEISKISIGWNEKLIKSFDSEGFTPEQVKRRTGQIQKDIDTMKEWEKQSKTANHVDMGRILNKIIDRYSLD